ncbi:MAG: OsmC family protein [Acidobacteria bacterium]|nr:OsmC family protein [Acidobacteriota bacterium]
MTTATDQLRDTLERNARALALRPSIGQNTAITMVRLTEGLACEVEEGPWKLRVDMSPKSGGAGSAPNPGVLGRASLGSCLAIGYAMWAARRGVALEEISVEVQADFDTAAEYGLTDDQPGYHQVRCNVKVRSKAPAEEVRAVIEEADRCSSYLAVWTKPQDVRLNIEVTE